MLVYNLVDFHSKWLDAHIMHNITSSRTIEKLRQIFSIHGLPRKIVTDNGPSSAPYHPSTNGLVERAVQTVKRGLQCIQGSSIQEKLSKFLFTHWITPHSTTGVAPSELLMGRRLRSRLDGLFPKVNKKIES